MKRTLSLFLCLVLVVLCFPLSSSAEEEIAFGESTFSFDGADSMQIAGKSFDAVGEAYKFTININVSGCEDSGTVLYLNEKFLGRISDGYNSFEVSFSDVIDGENSILMRLATGNGTYSDNMIYGSMNLDDIVVISVTFGGLKLKTPENTDLFIPIQGAAGYNVKRVAYAENLTIGDGWFAETNLGGSTPNTPIGCAFIFEKPDMTGLFPIDTLELPDGTHVAEFYKDNNKIGSKEYTIDNTPPIITFSASDNVNIPNNGKLTYSVDDITNTNTELFVDGKKAASINCDRLSIGRHYACVKATDGAGHSATKTIIFNIVKNSDYSVEIGESSVKMTVSGSATVYGAQLLKDIRMYQNRLGEFSQDFLRSSDEVMVSFDEKETVITEAVGNTMPYQSFVVNTEGKKGNAVVSYSGTTGNGSDIILKAWNYTDSRWDDIARTPSGTHVSVSVDIKTYSKGDAMRINAMPYLISNGSDTILWNSDTQYYSRYDDLNDTYYAINNYAVSLYKSGKIGYALHTGDLIDRTQSGDEIANKEYSVADKAQSILDDALVPNGVVSGNHDIMHDAADYSYYWRYFGENRYKDFEWYGGSLNNNMHHFDLVTIGAYDFLFLYVGCYREDDPTAVAWANAVCRAYPNRNVVICTHEYILPSGAYSGDRAETIWNEIAVPNENVVMILCGHNEGVCDQLHRVGESDRYVLEILADYQFSELGTDPQHVENNCTCDGEGFVRMMSFTESSQLVSTTYSPSADITNFFPSYSDSFVYDLDLIKSNRSICTTSFDIAVKAEALGEFGKDEISLCGYDAFYAEIDSKLTEVFALKEYESGHEAEQDAHDYNKTFEKVSAGGLANVSENLKRGEVNSKPDAELVENGLNLLPDNASVLVKTSGAKVYEAKLNESGGVEITHQQDGSANWVTLANVVNKTVDVSKYNRVYFGVTADKSAKWNLYVNFAGKSINFSQDLYADFGYVNSVPSDITGTWQGYIDLSELVSGEIGVASVYLVTATPGSSITFDYLFLGSSNASKVRFITDDVTVTAVEAAPGSEISMPSAPFKAGTKFVGWFTEAEGGTEVTFPIKASEAVTDVYARFAENATSEKAERISHEVIIDEPPYVKIVLICASIIIVIVMTLFLLAKKKKSKGFESK